ncbi:MAG: hypothetical protein Q9219_004506 [cf. Caloplaca sp. 3 TL-2023]
MIFNAMTMLTGPIIMVATYLYPLPHLSSCLKLLMILLFLVKLLALPKTARTIDYRFKSSGHGRNVNLKKHRGKRHHHIGHPTSLAFTIAPSLTPPLYSGCKNLAPLSIVNQCNALIKVNSVSKTSRCTVLDVLHGTSGYQGLTIHAAVTSLLESQANSLRNPTATQLTRHDVGALTIDRSSYNTSIHRPQPVRDVCESNVEYEIISTGAAEILRHMYIDAQGRCNTSSQSESITVETYGSSSLEPSEAAQDSDIHTSTAEHDEPPNTTSPAVDSRPMSQPLPSLPPMTWTYPAGSTNASARSYSTLITSLEKWYVTADDCERDTITDLAASLDNLSVNGKDENRYKAHPLGSEYNLNYLRPGILQVKVTEPTNVKSGVPATAAAIPVATFTSSTSEQQVTDQGASVYEQNTPDANTTRHESDQTRCSDIKAAAEGEKAAEPEPPPPPAEAADPEPASSSSKARSQFHATVEDASQDSEAESSPLPTPPEGLRTPPTEPDSEAMDTDPPMPEPSIPQEGDVDHDGDDGDDDKVCFLRDGNGNAMMFDEGGWRVECTSSFTPDWSLPGFVPAPEQPPEEMDTKEDIPYVEAEEMIWESTISYLDEVMADAP